MEDLRQKLKLFNYRPLVLIFLGLIGGCLVSNYLGIDNIAIIIVGVLSFAVILLYSILHRKLMYLIIIAVAFVVGFSAYTIFTNTHTHSANNLIGTKIEATVTSVKPYDNCLGLLLEDVKIDGKKEKYNITLYYYNSEEVGYKKIEKGTKISFTVEGQGTVEVKNEDGEPHTYNISNNIGAEVSTTSVDIKGKQFSIRNSVLKRIRNNFRFGLNNQNAETIFSAMFGDKTYLNHDLYDAYKASGVAHLLAVSGLHVGLVVAILNFLMKKLKAKDWIRIAIVAILLFAYAYLCDFSYSVIRASIMALVLMMAPMFFSEYDTLNAISFAGIIVLIIEPIALFDVGAQLSFGCVFGIASLSSIFSRLIKNVPISSKAKDGFCISLSTIIATAMIMAKYFGGIQPISLVSNIIILPIFGVLFTITFVVAMVSTLLPFVCYLLIFVNPLFEWLNWAIICIANIAKGLSLMNVNYLTVMLWFAFIAFAGRYNVKQGLSRIAIISTCASVVALQIALIQ